MSSNDFDNLPFLDPAHFASPVNESCICPICQSVMKNPVSCHNGHSFCSVCIRRWLAANPTCPVDRAAVDASQLVPNRSLAAIISQMVLKICPSRSRTCGKFHATVEKLIPHIRNNCAEDLSGMSPAVPAQSASVQSAQSGPSAQSGRSAQRARSTQRARSKQRARTASRAQACQPLEANVLEARLQVHRARQAFEAKDLEAQAAEARVRLAQATEARVRVAQAAEARIRLAQAAEAQVRLAQENSSSSAESPVSFSLEEKAGLSAIVIGVILAYDNVRKFDTFWWLFYIFAAYTTAFTLNTHKSFPTLFTATPIAINMLIYKCSSVVWFVVWTAVYWLLSGALSHRNNTLTPGSDLPLFNIVSTIVVLLLSDSFDHWIYHLIWSVTCCFSIEALVLVITSREEPLDFVRQIRFCCLSFVLYQFIETVKIRLFWTFIFWLAVVTSATPRSWYL